MKNTIHKPPVLSRLVLSFLVNHKHPETVLADFDEQFCRKSREKGRFTAILWFWLQIVTTIPSFVNNSIYWSFTMYRSYFKIALRVIKKNKIYSFINIFGLSVGIACSIVIFLFVQDELTFDTFHENADNIYRVAQERKGAINVSGTAITFAWMAPSLVMDYPEVLDAVRIYRPVDIVLSYDEKRFNENIIFADDTFFDIFTFPLLRGDKSEVLKNPGSAVMTESLARKYFGFEDPIGKLLNIDSKLDVIVTGILKDIPRNSHFTFEILVRFEDYIHFHPEENYGPFENVQCKTYLLLDNNSSYKEFDEKLPEFLLKYRGEASAQRTRYYLQPLTSIHLNSDLFSELGENSSIMYSYILSGLALLILIIACINYINLTTARVSRRIKEVGIRKVAGANRKQLVLQFFGETFLMAFISLVLAVGLAYVLLPYFNNISGKDLSLNIIENMQLYLAFVCITLFVGLISGVLPAFTISSFQPVDVIKGKLKRTSIVGTVLRKGLVMSQFALSLILITGSIIAFTQLDYVRNRNLGIDKDLVLVVTAWKDHTLTQRFDTIKNELLQYPNILKVSRSGWMFDDKSINKRSYVPEGLTEEESILIPFSEVGEDFFGFFDIQFIEGRNFLPPPPNPLSRSNERIINESAARQLNWEFPVGKQIYYPSFDETYTIVGVVKDFNIRSLHEEIKPTVFEIDPNSSAYFYVKISPEDIAGTIAFIESKWQTYSPQLILQYTFLDDQIASLYQEEQKAGKIVGYAAFIAILLAALGLFGLSTFTAEQRIKEIGIRKTLGATVPNIVLLLSRDFMKLFVIANIVALPVAFIVSENWLRNFAYRISLDWWIFALAASIIFAISFITISYQSIKAASANPVEALKYE